MSETNSRDHGREQDRDREGSSNGNRGHNRSGGRKFDKRGGSQGRREERRGDRRDERRGSRDGAQPRRDDRRSNHKGHDRDKHKVSHPQRSGYREERINRRMTDPDLPSDIDITDLDPSVLQDLSSLSKENSEAVAKHLIMAATWLDDDPKLSLRHARAAKDRAGRVSVAREMNGIAAYRAGEWKEALAELRAARRISGGPGLLAVMADCERGLGRPEKAVELWRSEDAKELAPEDAIELAIVAAGARLDMGQADSAVVTIQRAQPNKDATGVAACRLSYAYGNALLEAGRKDEAKEWFQHASDIDEGDWTDAAERLAEF